MKGKEYIYIGMEIYSFKAKSEIIEYVSPVGNSDVPYPYAVDKDGRIYLMIENVILERGYDSKNYEDPYDFYYDDFSLISFKGIKRFMIGNQIYNFTYRPFPDENYDRITNFNETPQKLYIKVENKGEEDGKIKVLNKNAYVSLHRAFAKEKGYLPLEKNIIVERLF